MTIHSHPIAPTVLLRLDAVEQAESEGLPADGATASSSVPTPNIRIYVVAGFGYGDYPTMRWDRHSDLEHRKNSSSKLDWAVVNYTPAGWDNPRGCLRMRPNESRREQSSNSPQQ